MISLNNNQSVYIGCMTGTSVDHYADFVAVVFNHKTQLPSSFKTTKTKLPSELRQKLLLLSTIQYKKILPYQRDQAEQALTEFLAASYLQVIKKLKLNQLPKSQIILSPHGQTIHHAPLDNPPICDVLLDPQSLANKTGYQVVARHRQKVLPISMAAPLAPVLIKHLFSGAQQNTLLLNGGGIANICLLPSHKNEFQTLIAYDTGPANGPLDSIIHYVLQNTPNSIPKDLFKNIRAHEFDYQGLWAQQGQCQKLLLNKLLQHEYFSRDHSQKSADRADFEIYWILSTNKLFNYSWEDVLATVSELVIVTIEQAILGSLKHANIYTENINQTTRLIVYGGLAHNQFIISNLEKRLKTTFIPMEKLGYDPDSFEALLMAYLGFCVKNNIKIDLSYCKRENISDNDAQAVPGEVFKPKCSYD